MTGPKGELVVTCPLERASAVRSVVESPAPDFQEPIVIGRIPAKVTLDGTLISGGNSKIERLSGHRLTDRKGITDKHAVSRPRSGQDLDILIHGPKGRTAAPAATHRSMDRSNRDSLGLYRRPSPRGAGEFGVPAKGAGVAIDSTAGCPLGVGCSGPPFACALLACNTPKRGSRKPAGCVHLKCFSSGPP